MSGGGAGGSGTQKFEWNEGTAPYWEQALGMGNYISGLGLGGAPTKQYERYPGQRIADLNTDQGAAMGAIRDYVSDPRQSLYGVGNEEYAKTLQGNYLTGQGANPFVTNNAYEGENPYFQSVLNRGMGDIATKYREATAPQENANAVLAGVMGGGDHERATAKNQEILAKELSNYDSQMRSGQYDRSANLYENYLQRGSGAFEGERGRQMGAGQASQNDQNLTLQRYNALMGVGDISRGLSQDYLNQYFNDWQEQQNYPYKQLDYMTGLLGRAQGGMSPNMTQTQAGYSASPFSQLLGAGLLGYGMTR